MGSFLGSNSASRRSRRRDNIVLTLDDGAEGLPSRDPLKAGEGGSPVPMPQMLTRMIEGEIIPRLLLAHRHDDYGDDAASPGRRTRVGADDVITTARIALAGEARDIILHVDRLVADGIEPTTLLVEMMPPAARMLGDWWEADISDFVEVTMALWRLQEAVHHLSARFPGQGEDPGQARRALFVVPPGEQHSFGSVIVEECFRRAGWNTWGGRALSMPMLVDLAGRRWFEIIGLTVTCDRHIGQLPSVIRALRTASRNPDVAVMVGGRLFSDRPELAEGVGADLTATDARLAVRRAEEVVDQRIARSGTPAPDSV